jgi:predicted transcriptional regulator
MANKIKSKTRYLDINVKQGSFMSRFISGQKEYDFSDVSLLRKLLSNQKARILFTLKQKKPKSIYSLAKILGRDFKSVSDDVKILEKFGFIEFHEGKTGKRAAKMPVLVLDQLDIVLNI